MLSYLLLPHLKTQPIFFYLNILGITLKTKTPFLTMLPAAE